MKLARKITVLSLAAMLSVVSFSSCKLLNKIFSSNLEDEDFIVEQLYADEYVKEETVRRPKTPDNKANNGSAGSKCGMELNDKDNPKLYEAIDSWYGTPYLYGGCSTSGVDCSCFVGHIFKTVYGVSLHRVASDIQKDVYKDVKRNDLREGDIVFFTNSKGKVGHVGIYLKEDMFVHSSTSKGVIISSLENSYWKNHFYKGGRHKSVTTKYK